MFNAFLQNLYYYFFSITKPHPYIGVGIQGVCIY